MTSELSVKLYTVLSHQYALYLKTQNYHWNIEGAHFANLHALFEEHYTELSGHIDATAEHIRGLGNKVSTNIDQLFQVAKTSPANENATESEMLFDLIQSHTNLESVLAEVVKASQDEVINGYLIDCMGFHRKAVWVLKSSTNA